MQQYFITGGQLEILNLNVQQQTTAIHNVQPLSYGYMDPFVDNENDRDPFSHNLTQFHASYPRPNATPCFI